MIYIYTEDSTDGFEMCKIIKKLYFDGIFNDIVVDTLHGIWSLKDKLKDILKIATNPDDVIIIVYDDIKENLIISQFLDEAQDYVYKHNIYNKIKWLPTKSFELEIMLILGIELFMNKENYRFYFRDLRDKYIETDDIYELTKMSKQNNLYDDMYIKARREKLKRRIYARLSTEDFEKTITIETISKDIIKKMFISEDGIGRPMQKCWVNNCCCQHHRCRNNTIDFDLIIEKQKQEDLYKTKFLIINTSYSKLIKAVYELKDKYINLPEINIDDMVSLEILEANYLRRRCLND